MTTSKDYNEVSDEEMKQWVDEILVTLKDDDNGDFEQEIKKLKPNDDDGGIPAPEIKPKKYDGLGL